MVKLLRTDTTLDLSQKARVVRISHVDTLLLYRDALRTDHIAYGSKKLRESELPTGGARIKLEVTSRFAALYVGGFDSD